VTALLALALVAAQPQPQYLGEYRVTAYCAHNCPICCGRWARYHKTATGRPARGAIVAVDPRVVPLHSTIHVQGIGWLRAEDKGGKIKGRRLDVLLPTHAEARRFGVRRLRVWRVR
jgi:3D (Asp-Asp-Asp) domain-containing protein